MVSFGSKFLEFFGFLCLGVVGVVFKDEVFGCVWCCLLEVVVWMIVGVFCSFWFRWLVRYVDREVKVWRFCSWFWGIEILKIWFILDIIFVVISELILRLVSVIFFLNWLVGILVILVSSFCNFCLMFGLVGCFGRVGVVIIGCCWRVLCGLIGFCLLLGGVIRGGEVGWVMLLVMLLVLIEVVVCFWFVCESVFVSDVMWIWLKCVLKVIKISLFDFCLNINILLMFFLLDVVVDVV